MIHTLRGKLTERTPTFFVVECNGVGYKVTAGERTLTRLPELGSEILVFTSLFIREERQDLFGFLEEESLKLFELLNTVGGVGPRTALGVLDIDSVPNIIAAIIEKRADLLTRASGIGKKTAERVILELQSKLHLSGAEMITKQADQNREVEEVLLNLGYARGQIRGVVDRLSKDVTGMEARLKAALKELGRATR
ncbi:MAG: Holliday junction branch migration protein RuvA [Candidatus Jorgensenbacteria bacterium]|nr:Holliday junction branch migration protein RuvA [Candidatus Jorgensenbacteria bacterium]